jgi:hypothetical protein
MAHSEVSDTKFVLVSARKSRGARTTNKIKIILLNGRSRNYNSAALNMSAPTSARRAIGAEIFVQPAAKRGVPSMPLAPMKRQDRRRGGN